LEESITREGSYKAAKGLIRIKTHIEKDKIREAIISGDFFMYPEDELWELERILVGTKASREEVLLKVRTFYERSKVLTPGVNPEDFAEAIMRSVEGTSS